MALLCAESLRRLKYGEPLHVVTRQAAKSFEAVGHEVIASIAPAERRSTPCPADEKGFDIHAAVAGFNPISGTYSWLEGFEKKEFLFSISEETAKRVMPTHWTRTYAPDEMPDEPEFRVNVEVANPALVLSLLDRSDPKSRLN